MTIREMKARAELEEHVTAEQLALLVGVAEETIRRLGRAGKIPSRKVGRCVRYPRVDALDAMSQRAIGATVDH
jgi:excisionase family DNA binding protein